MNDSIRSEILEIISNFQIHGFAKQVKEYTYKITLYEPGDVRSIFVFSIKLYNCKNNRKKNIIMLMNSMITLQYLKKITKHMSFMIRISN